MSQQVLIIANSLATLEMILLCKENMEILIIFEVLYKQLKKKGFQSLYFVYILELKDRQKYILQLISDEPLNYY